MKIIILLIITLLMGCLLHAEPLTPEKILSQAQERIERYRMTEATIQFTGADGNPLPAGKEITIEQTRHKFLFGSNIFLFNNCRTEQNNDLYKQRFAELFNYATLPFYWSGYEPQQGKTNMNHLMKTAQWCKDNHIIAKGCPLFWTTEPLWIKQLSPEKQHALLFDRISREIEEFKGLIDMWDVFIDPVSGIQRSKENNAIASLRAFETHGIAGTLMKAVTKARAASANAVLIINDYDTGSKFENIIQECIDKNVNFDIIGIQSPQHSGPWSISHIWDICERFSQFQKPLHFTETTFVSGSGRYNHWEKTSPEGEKQQAQEVVQYYTILFSHPAVEAISWWDFTDLAAWQNAPAGLIREDMSPKPAYEALLHLIKEKWWTPRQTAVVDAEGKIKIKAFYGDYKVSARIKNEIKTTVFAIDKNDFNKTVSLK